MIRGENANYTFVFPSPPGAILGPGPCDRGAGTRASCVRFSTGRAAHTSASMENVVISMQRLDSRPFEPVCAERCSRSIDRCTGGSAIWRSSSGRSCTDRSFRDRAQYESYVPGSYRGRLSTYTTSGSVRSVLPASTDPYNARAAL